ncbi:uncharacterized protein LOC111319944 [Stylophora pistillata]|nr:uncharacterized protein LOC111319944 [Stylophora pistillata]
MGAKFHAFVFLTVVSLCFPGLHIVKCITSNASSPPSAIPTGLPGLPRTTAVSTPSLHPLPQPNLIALLPISSSTAQPTRPTESALSSTSCSADVKMINPAHAQLFSGATPPNLEPTAPHPVSFESACHHVAKNVYV